MLCACSAESNDTSGPDFVLPETVGISSFTPSSASKVGSGYLDTSNLANGYVGASITSSARCKLQIIKDDESYNYDIPSDGSPIVVPLNMGDGVYEFRFMQNTSGSNYINVGHTSANVALNSEFAPYLYPNIFCSYSADSAVAQKAKELARDAKNEGDVVKGIYRWISENISYDKAKAAQLADATGYIPNPDEVLASGTGICFDYASLAAAMFRSLGIPCQIITGYVDPNNLYHAWNMIYIDGQWVSAEFSVDPNTWTRVDLTFAAASSDSSEYVGEGKTYTDRYVY